MATIITEVCACNLQSAFAAMLAGASRIELCDNLSENGSTPSYGNIAVCKEQLKIPMHVFVAARGGNFYYTEAETEAMLNDILLAKKLAVNGFVFGTLTPQNQIDKTKMKLLMQAAAPTPVTFHRAFDLIADKFDALETLIELGVKRVLTSGGQKTAEEGMAVIKQLVKQSHGRIEVIAAAGITEKNVQQIIYETNVSAVHFTAKKPVFANRNDDTLPFSTRFAVSDQNRIADIVQLVHQMES